MSKNKYRAVLSLEIDLEEYPVPADGKIKQQLKQDITDALYDVGGITVKKIDITGKDLLEEDY